MDHVTYLQLTGATAGQQALPHASAQTYTPATHAMPLFMGGFSISSLLLLVRLVVLWKYCRQGASQPLKGCVCMQEANLGLDGPAFAFSFVSLALLATGVSGEVYSLLIIGLLM
uniref:Uncharacterized protein n=1 Tax=Arundo donax TaxID=35708 RepID=A0A0A8YGH9_ARUDO